MLFACSAVFKDHKMEGVSYLETPFLCNELCNEIKVVKHTKNSPETISSNYSAGGSICSSILRGHLEINVSKIDYYSSCDYWVEIFKN